MKKIIPAITEKVMLPLSSYELSIKEKRMYEKSLQDGDMQIYGGKYVGAVYCHNGICSTYGCLSFLPFSFGKDTNKFIAQDNMIGVGQIKIANNPEMDNSSLVGELVKYTIPKSGKEVLNVKLRQRLLDLAGFDKDKIVNEYTNPQEALKLLSFLLVDRIFPGNNHVENLIRLNFLSETSENKRLQMLETILFRKEKQKGFTNLQK